MRVIPFDLRNSPPSFTSILAQPVCALVLFNEDRSVARFFFVIAAESTGEKLLSGFCALSARPNLFYGQLLNNARRVRRLAQIVMHRG